MFNFLKALLIALVLSLGIGQSAFAVPPDFSGISTAADFSTVGTGILAIAAVLALALVVKKGAHMVLSMIGK